MNYDRVRRQPPTSATATFWLTQRRPRVTFGCSRCACPAHLAWITSLGTYRLGDLRLFEHAPRYHTGGLAGSGLLPDEVPIIARRRELVASCRAGRA